MLTVTEAAAQRLAQKLTKKNAEDDAAMRLEREVRGWKFRLDTPGPDDVAVTHKNRTVLVLDREVAHLLAERTLDARNTSAGSRLYLR